MVVINAELRIVLYTSIFIRSILKFSIKFEPGINFGGKEKISLVFWKLQTIRRYRGNRNIITPIIIIK